MRGRVLVLAGACLAMLSACAAPRAVGQGDLSALRGASLAPYASQADGADAAFAKAVQARAVERLSAAAGGANGGGKGAPAYLVQVGVATAPSGLGVSSASGALDASAWRSAPPKARPWSRKGPVRIVTLAVIDTGSGKTVAWSSIRQRKGEPAATADQLIQALQAPAKR
jgi:hypothetical protein